MFLGNLRHPNPNQSNGKQRTKARVIAFTCIVRAQEVLHAPIAIGVEQPTSTFTLTAIKLKRRSLIIPSARSEYFGAIVVVVRGAVVAVEVPS